MSSNFVKNSLVGTLRVTSGRDGSRTFNSGHGGHLAMDDGHKVYSGRGSRSRGRFRGRGRGYSSFRAHDDRDSGKSITERLGDRIGYKGRGRDSRGRRGGNSRGRSYNAAHSEYRDPNKIVWYQVTIPFGAKLTEKYIYESINDLLEYKFDPQMFGTDGEAAVFYVELSIAGADALKSLNKRIPSSNGRKMIIIVRPADPPVPKTIEGALLEKLQEAMSSKYNPETRVLNLSEFHKNEDLKPASCLPLNRHSVMSSVVNIIGEHIPEIVGLNLSGNRLKSFEYLSKLVPKTPHLTALDLSNNDIYHEAALDKLSGWKLTEIHLKNTPFFNRFDDMATYLSAVRKKFPKVIKLDGESAPVPIGFDLEESNENMPVAKGNYLGQNPQVQETVVSFVQEFIKVFDSGSRISLQAAYHDKAMLSVSYWYCNDPSHAGDKQVGFDDIKQWSRNLKTSNHPDRMIKSLKQGKDECLKLLLDYPQTTHLLESLTLDIVNDTEQMPSFTISGLVEEKSKARSTGVVRLITHNFVIVPCGGGYVIISHQICLNNISKSEKERFVANVKKSQDIQTPQNIQPPSVSAEDKQAMIQEFMKNSGMNAEWSKQCLSISSWDFNEAAKSFTEAKTNGAIPPDAFR